MNKVWQQDFAEDQNWLQVRRASRNAETALYYVWVVGMFGLVLYGWVMP